MSKEYEVTFTVELEEPFEKFQNLDTADNLAAFSEKWGDLFIPDTATVTELAPKFEPGYFIDMWMSDEERSELIGDTPRTVRWLDEDLSSLGWVRVAVRDRTSS